MCRAVMVMQRNAQLGLGCLQTAVQSAKRKGKSVKRP